MTAPAEEVAELRAELLEARETIDAIRALNTELESRVRERTTALEQASMNLESFTNAVSHDLRAPLRALSGFSDALAEEYDERLDETGRGYTERIKAASERMATLLDGLLQLSRVSRAGLSARPVDLSAEVAMVADDLRAAAPGRTVRLRIQPGVLVMADRNLMRSVVQNLLDNAWKFTSQREDAVIEFGAVAREDAETCYFVRDNGVGFDSAYAEKLFVPFQRLHSLQEFSGSGIGLATVRRIIERHDGRTWADSIPGEGATFFFTLPVPDWPASDSPASEDDLSEPTRSAAGARPPGSPAWRR
jgi:light-regulated signal transduction histidine kinase (bacteriophytochrome)